jgi:hypothetical protein
MLAELLAIVISTGAVEKWPAPVLYQPVERAVSNWRLQAALHLDGQAERRVGFITGAAPPANLPRCIRLNNYWCIKSARWNGEIATDNEGHVAFSSADEGATVAAQLLRRYYVDFGRKSAMAIVSRWAPAECGRPVVSRVATGRGGKPGAKPLPPTRSKADSLAVRGIGGTLRARWLASHRPGGARRGGRVAVVRSRVPDRATPMLRAPSIAVGMGERIAPAPVALAPVRLASLELPASIGKPEPAVPLFSCAGDMARIRNYAGKIIEGVAANDAADLKLFDEQGLPTANLARAMLNMASVEIGPFRVEESLVRRAIDLLSTAPKPEVKPGPAPDLKPKTD